jgi:hypothetical protein
MERNPKEPPFPAAGDERGDVEEWRGTNLGAVPHDDFSPLEAYEEAPGPVPSMGDVDWTLEAGGDLLKSYERGGQDDIGTGRQNYGQKKGQTENGSQLIDHVRDWSSAIVAGSELNL